MKGYALLLSLITSMLLIMSGCSVDTPRPHTQPRNTLDFGAWQARGTMDYRGTRKEFNAITIGSSIRLVEVGDVHVRQDYFIGLDDPIVAPEPWGLTGRSLRLGHLFKGPEDLGVGVGSLAANDRTYHWAGDPLTLKRIDSHWGSVSYADFRPVFLEGSWHLAPHHLTITPLIGDEVSIVWERYGPLPTKGSAGAPARSQ